MLVEGVDNSVLLLIAVFLCVFIFVIYKLSGHVRHGRPLLHPDSIVDVTLTRELLAQQQQQQQQNGNQAIRQSRYQREESLQCPICLVASDYPIETNCGHLFCGNCIIQHWHVKTHNILHSKIPCPICRQSVTMLLPLFSLEIQQSTDDYRTMIRHINNYNRKFSGAPRPFMDYIYDLPTLLRHAFVQLFSLDGLNFWYRLRVMVIFLVAFVYLLTPFDLIPESVFGLIGMLDDVCIIFMLGIYITIFYRQFVANGGTGMPVGGG